MCACIAAGALLLSNNLNSIIMSKGKTSIKKSDVKFFEVLEHDIFQKNRKENGKKAKFNLEELKVISEKFGITLDKIIKLDDEELMKKIKE